MTLMTMVSRHGSMTIGMSLANLRWTELLLVQHAFAKSISTLMVILFRLLAMLWRRKKKV